MFFPSLFDSLSVCIVPITASVLWTEICIGLSPPGPTQGQYWTSELPCVFPRWQIPSKRRYVSNHYVDISWPYLPDFIRWWRSRTHLGPQLKSKTACPSGSPPALGADYLSQVDLGWFFWEWRTYLLWYWTRAHWHISAVKGFGQ